MGLVWDSSINKHFALDASPQRPYTFSSALYMSILMWRRIHVSIYRSHACCVLLTSSELPGHRLFVLAVLPLLPLHDIELLPACLSALFMIRSRCVVASSSMC